jgi:hypothetical protein
VHLFGAMSLVYAALYAVPRTSVFGAIPLTGFLGFRVGEIATAPQLVSLLLGVVAWGALYWGASPSAADRPRLHCPSRPARREGHRV